MKLKISQQPPPGDKDWYLFEGIRAIPRILIMVDRNPVSPTYGCFDREYWHYRTVDFPCGMNQEQSLALAAAWATNNSENPFHQSRRIRDVVQASLRYASSSAHKDGTCDDYFPFEKALGALVFSLYAMTESYQLLGLEDPAVLAFLEKRGAWLLNHNESGQLANHQALAALALQNVFLLTGDQKFRDGAVRFRDLTLSWQKSEGWFQEYEGADPGYHSCSIDFLAKLRQKSGDDVLTEPLLRAARFARHFMHPDGSYAGEYGSRNTYHFYPHGFELLAGESPEALEIVELFLRKGLPMRTRYFNDDNRMCAHYVYDWLQAWQDYAEIDGRSSIEVQTTAEPIYLDQAKLLVIREPAYHAVVAASKGGVIKVMGADGPVLSDTGPMIKPETGPTLVTHLVSDDNQVNWDPESSTLKVQGFLCKRRAPIMTPFKQIVFRILTLTLGRISPSMFRILIQKLFITGKPRTESRFERIIRFRGNSIEIEDRIHLDGTPPGLESVVAAPDSTSIYVANSNTYQATNLLPLRHLDDLRNELANKGTGTETFVLSVGEQA
jgi:hypothetical protein